MHSETTDLRMLSPDVHRKHGRQASRFGRTIAVDQALIGSEPSDLVPLSERDTNGKSLSEGIDALFAGRLFRC